MEVESFEVSGAEVVGDLLSPDRIQSRRPLKIGFMAQVSSNIGGCIQRL